MQVVIDHDTDRRSRECPDCGSLGPDAHVAVEGRQTRRVYRRRRRVAEHDDR